MADTDVVYTFRAEDKISEPMKRAEQQLNRTEDASKKCTEAQQTAILKSVEATNASKKCTEVQQTAILKSVEVTNASKRCTEAQQTAILKSVEVMTALHAVQAGLSAVTSSVRTLGIVDEETALTLQKVTAGIQLVVGTAQAIKGVVTLFQTLNAVLKTTAIVSTFAAIAENPAKGALIVGAAGLAAGAVGGYMYSAMQQNNTTNTTINVAHTETARQAETAVQTGTWY